MALEVNTNIPALNAQRNASANALARNKSMAQVASGLRINRAADDAAGLAIAERFRSQVRQYTTEASNFQTAVNVVSTAEGGLQSQSEAVGRIRELAVQAANGTLSQDQRAALNNEAQQLMGQIDQTAQNTEFNGQKLLNGGTGPISVGDEGGTQININESSTNTMGLNAIDLTTAEGAQAALGTLDTAANQIGQNRAALGAQQNRFESAIQTRETGMQSAAESESRIRDADMAKAVSQNVRAQLLGQMSTGALTQANVSSQNALKLLSA